MASITVIIIGGAIANALGFSGSNYMFSKISKKSIRKERRRYDKAMKDMQKAQIE